MILVCDGARTLAADYPSHKQFLTMMTTTTRKRKWRRTRRTRTSRVAIKITAAVPVVLTLHSDDEVDGT
jgi:hypothetical protein